MGLVVAFFHFKIVQWVPHLEGKLPFFEEVNYCWTTAKSGTISFGVWVLGAKFYTHARLQNGLRWVLGGGVGVPYSVNPL